MLTQVFLHRYCSPYAIARIFVGIALGARSVARRGDQPFVRRLLGISFSPLVGSIYVLGMRDKSAAAWVNVESRRTFQSEATTRQPYKETGHSLGKGGGVGEPVIMVDRCVVFLSILHCCMAIGRLQVAFMEAPLVDLPKENAKDVQQVHYQARTGVKLGASAIPDAEEAHAVPWYTREDPISFYPRPSSLDVLA